MRMAWAAAWAMVGTTTVVLILADSVSAASKFATFQTCEECVAAGHGWSLKKGKCGKFATSKCPQKTVEKPVLADLGHKNKGFKPATDSLKATAIRTVEFSRSSPVIVDDDNKPTWDEKGYIMAHYCQGRFGTQMDSLMLLMELAQETGRTLVMPPFADWTARKTMGKVPWFWWGAEVFDIGVMNERGFKAIDLGTFMAHFRNEWKSHGFTGHCSFPHNRPEGWAETCMRGNTDPKKAFWDNLDLIFDDIKFAGSVTVADIKSLDVSMCDIVCECLFAEMGACGWLV